MTVPYLTTSTRGHYGYRRVIPEPLRGTIGKREIKKALGADLAEAMRLYAHVHRETEKLIKAARSKAPGDSQRELVIRKMRQFKFSEADIATVAAGRVEPETPLAEGLSIFQDGLAWDHEQDERRRVKPAVSVETIRAIGNGQLPEVTYTVNSALDHYIEVKSTGVHARDLALSNRVDLIRQRLIGVIGKAEVTKRPLADLTRAEARKFRDFLAGIMSPASVKRSIEIISPAINLLIKEHDLDLRNPFAGLEIKGATNSRDSRHPLTEEDMKTLHTTMVRSMDDGLSAIWVALRDTGARLGEICRLRAMDMDLTGECIHIRPYGHHTLKTKNSERTVPLSPDALSRLKLAAENLKAEQPLFPNYAGPRRPEAASAALMKRLRTQIDDNKKTVHSLRHRMKDRLRNTNCPEAIAQEVMGHSSQGVAFNYGAGYSLKVKREALEKVWD